MSKVSEQPATADPDWDKLLRAAAGSKLDKFNTVLLNETLATIWCPPGADKQYRDNRLLMAVAAMQAFQPNDEIEGMIAAQAVSMHLASMECFRRAMLSEQPGDAAARLRKDGANLARGMTDMLAALDRKRGKTSNQVVRVERVTIQPGGQAIVGNVTSGTPGGGAEDGSGEEPHASPAGLAHDAAIGPSLTTLRGKDKERMPVPVSRNGER